MTKASRYSHYMLAILLVSYILNSLDRSILGILLEPISKEFGIHDWQMGLLSGLSFALMYSTLALPIAHWADRLNRRNILALAILIWSVGTIFCGLATSFLLLLLSRSVTAAGEAGCNPPSHSLIADYFQKRHYATALGIYAFGAPAGSSLAGLIGGYGLESFGWRTTFIIAGVPGLLVAASVFATLREPRTSIPSPNLTATLPFASVARSLLQHRSFRWMCIASALHSAAIYGAATFNASYLMRTHGWNGIAVGKLLAFMGIAGAVGTLLGGYVADRLNHRHAGEYRWHMWVPALASLAVIPLQLVNYLGSDSTLMITTFCIAAFLNSIFFGPAFASAQALAAPRQRAIAAALLLFFKALLGMGLGPLLVGVVSDYLGSTHMQYPLRYALMLLPLFNLASGIVYFVAAKYYRQDLSSVE